MLLFFSLYTWTWNGVSRNRLDEKEWKFNKRNDDMRLVKSVRGVCA